MITSMHIENFKCFKNFDIELGPFNVLIGPNDSGKTALLQAIQLGGMREEYHINIRNKLDEWGVGSATILHWNSDLTLKAQIQLHANAMDVPLDCRISFCEVMAQQVKNGIKDTINPRERRNTPSSKGWKENAIGQIDYLRFNPTSLRQPTRLSDTFSSNGEGLPALIDNIRGDIENFKQFQDEFCSRFPYYKIIGKKVTPKNDMDLVGIEFVTKYDNTLPAVSVSDGVMLSLAFLALKYTRKKSGYHIFLIEEPENGVHPGALKEIRDTLWHLSQQKGIQVILTTHSPYLLDLVEPEEVRVFQKDDEGAVHAKKLSEFEDVEDMKKHFMTGEIWTMMSEKYPI